jgi:hypothetical protein
MRAILFGCLLAGCTSAEAVTVTGEIQPATVSPVPAHKILNVMFSPEHGGHRAYGATTVDIPSSFALDIPSIHSGFEDGDGFKYMAGQIVTSDDPLGDPDDGFDVPYDLTAYVLLYFTETPNVERPPFLVTDAVAGWNLLQAQPLTCDDAEDLGGGAIGWRSSYKVVPLDSPITIDLFAAGTEPWQPPLSCP